MKYSEVLFQYEPVEVGDFMFRYFIKEREFIIYSPENGKISCLELCNFSDLSPFQLKVAIQQFEKPGEELKEFSFQHVCSKGALVSYLFDLSSENTDMLKVRRVSNNKGYLLYALKSDGACKVRNLYQFEPETKRYQLVFENEVCCASVFEKEPSDVINVCWNPVVFNVLEGQEEHRAPSYLLASSNPVLCYHILKKAQEKKAKINLYVGNSKLEALVFFSLFLEYKKSEKGFVVFSNSRSVTVQMKNLAPVRVVKFISFAEKICAEYLKKKFGEEYIETKFFQLDSAADVSFVHFPKLPFVIEAFFRTAIMAIKREDISYIEL